jgi:hypothetical protein
MANSRPSRNGSTGSADRGGPASLMGPPRWVKVSGIAAAVIAVAFIAIFGI